MPRARGGGKKRGAKASEAAPARQAAPAPAAAGGGGKKRGAKASEAAPAREGSESPAARKKRQRQEKLKAWKESGGAPAPAAGPGAGPAPAPAPAQKRARPAEEEEDAAARKKRLRQERLKAWKESAPAAEPAAAEPDQAQGPDEGQDEAKSADENEEDPLDAFMRSLEDGGGAVAQVDDAVVDTAPKQISLDELQAPPPISAGAGTFMDWEETDDEGALSVDSEAAARAPLGGTTPGRPEETDAEREAREEREQAEFVAALKAAQAEEQQQEQATVKEKEQRLFQGDEDDSLDVAEFASREQRTSLEILAEQQRKRQLQAVDHDAVEYEPFSRNFFIQPRELAALSEEQRAELRAEMGMTVRGRACPPPVEKWDQCGLSERCLGVLSRMEFAYPFAIQRQAIPALMSGRDVIGVAKTGSGKTLAFLLPLFRHVLAQRPLEDGEGPIGLVMAPARELVKQIAAEAQRFGRALGLRCTAVYGGAGISDQIRELKRGSHVVVCTPGRMIDLLCMNSGRLVTLRRVTFCVLDEADRMFDLGFEPQIKRIINNTRPDRQTAMFSATFPKMVEALARTVLRQPLEIVVGGRSVASADIRQFVEIRPERAKFARLLQLLGHWYERGNVLVFVDSQERCDSLFHELMKAGYPCLSLHGGQPQADRSATISDFKKKVRTLMVATSLVGRGLDVPDLVLVVNYSCPNHKEEYVHRVGRTGRAGRKGTAYTFLAPEEEQFAPVIVRALRDGKQQVPEPLQRMADAFTAKVTAGSAREARNGYVMTGGYTFKAGEKSAAQRLQDAHKSAYEREQGMLSDSDGEEEESGGPEAALADSSAAEVREAAEATAAAQAAASTEAGESTPAEQQTALVPAVSDARSRALEVAKRLAMASKRQQQAGNSSALRMVRSGPNGVAHYVDELAINDYPLPARQRVTNKDNVADVSERSGAAITGRGAYTPPGEDPPAGERKLYLMIEGPTEHSVGLARMELQRLLDEATLEEVAAAKEAGPTAKFGRYSVL